MKVIGNKYSDRNSIQEKYFCISKHIWKQFIFKSKVYKACTNNYFQCCYVNNGKYSSCKGTKCILTNTVFKNSPRVRFFNILLQIPFIC